MDNGSTTTPLRPTERHVVSVLRDRDGATRRELADATGLPLTTVTATVAALIARGLLAESSDGVRRGVGRPATTVRIDLARRTVAAVELGRTHQSVTLMGCDGRVLDSAEIRLDLTRSFEDVAAGLGAAANSLSAAGQRPSAVVVSVTMPFRQGAGAPPFHMYAPGRIPTSPRTGWLLTDPSASAPDLLGVPAIMLTDPSAALTEALGVPVMIENDINLAALGEAVHGVARDAHTSVYLSVAPGFGAGIVIGGRLFRGAGGVAGELAHITVREDGDLCICGNRGCIITTRRNGPSLVDELAVTFGRPVSLEEVISRATEGDVTVRRWLTDLGRTMARPLIGFVTMLNPDLIVVDNALGPAADPVVAGLRETIERRTPPMTHHGLEVRPGRLAGAATPAGAAALAGQHYVDRLLA